MIDPIPSWLWERIKVFLAENRTGVITLGVSQGRIKDYELREFGKIVDKEKEMCVGLTEPN